MHEKVQVPRLALISQMVHFVGVCLCDLTLNLFVMTFSNQRRAYNKNTHLKDKIPSCGYFCTHVADMRMPFCVCMHIKLDLLD